MKTLFTFLLAAFLLMVLPFHIQAQQQKKVLHSWSEPNPAKAVNPQDDNKPSRVADKPFSVSTSKNAYRARCPSCGGYYLNSTATVDIHADYLTGYNKKIVDYHAEGWAYLTGDNNIIEPPSGDGINRKKIKRTSDNRSYNYDIREKTVKTKIGTLGSARTTAKTVFKRHPVYKGGYGKGGERVFTFYEKVTKHATYPNTPTPLDANPWARAQLSTDSNQFLNSTIRVARSVTPNCSSGGGNHTCKKDATEGNNGNNISNFVDNTNNCIYCTNGCVLCTITGPCGHTYSDVTASQHALQVNCPVTDANENTCTATNFYACQSHTHQYASLITGACGHTYTNSEASNHAWGTAPCGDDTHVGYLCQINASDHEWVYESCPSYHAHYECDGTDHSLQASCSETDSNGNTCTVSSFYACESHTHVYPAPTVSCARQACGQQVSNRLEHRQTCSAGHTYWTCISGATHNHTTVFTCSRPGCSVTFTLCSNGTCSSNWGTHPYHWAQ